MDKNIVIIYGLPCVGKTTILNELTDKRTTCVHIDSIWDELFVCPTYTKEEAELVFEELIKKIRMLFVKHKHFIFVEGVFASSGRMEILRNMALEFNYTFSAIFLYRPISELIVANVKRNKILAKPITKEALLSLEQSFSSQDYASLSIDTSMNSIAMTIQQIKNYLNGTKIHI